MSSFKMIYNNTWDKGSVSVSPSPAIGTAQDTKVDDKSAIVRMPSTSADLYTVLSSPEYIDGAAICFANLSPSATIRVRASNESAMQNQLTFSDYLSLTPWQFAGLYAIPNVGAAPSGISNAYKIVESASTPQLHEFYRAFNAVAGRRTTVSLYIKAAERSKVRFSFVTSAYQAGAGALFDLLTGTISSTTYYGGVSGAVTTMVQLPDGWFRCAVELTPPTDGSWYLAADLVTGTNTVNYAGDGISGVYVANAQVETGSLSSYYPATVNFTSRASTGTFIGSNGLLQTAAANVARMQYNPLNLAAPPFLLLEPAATNNFTYSDGTLATFGSGNVMAATVPIPGFTSSIQFGDNSVTRYAYKNSTGSIGTTIGATYTMSVFVMMDDGGVPFPGNTGNSAKDFAFVRENDAATSTGTVVHMGNNIYRCSYTFVATTTGTPSNGIAKYLLQSARGFKVAGYQLQLGAYADSFISTGVASGTRAADIATSTLATRPAGYIDSWQSYDYDSGKILACPPIPASEASWAADPSNVNAYTGDGTYPLGINYFPSGGYSYGTLWMEKTRVYGRGFMISLSDPSNKSGYIEFSRVVIGPSWSPELNAMHDGSSMSIADSTRQIRTDAGSMISDVGIKYKKQTLDVSRVSSTDRIRLWDILQRNGLSKPVFVSVFPGNANTHLEQSYQLYGKFTDMPGITSSYLGNYAVQLNIEEI